MYFYVLTAASRGTRVTINGISKEANPQKRYLGVLQAVIELAQFEPSSVATLFYYTVELPEEAS